MKRLAKTIRVFLTIAIFASCFCFVEKEDIFAETSIENIDDDYDYYYQLCTNVGTTLNEEEKQACRVFREYETRRQKEIETTLANIEAELRSIKGDINAQAKKIEELQNQILNLEKDIVAINSSINRIQKDIETLQDQIDERQNKIETIDDGIKNRMAATQSSVVLNSYIKFIMGADSFLDILRRISAINEITAYDQQIIEKVEEEKQLLVEDQNLLQQQKDSLVSEQEKLEKQKQINNELREAAQQLMEELQVKQYDFELMQDKFEEDRSYLDNVIMNVDMTVDELYPSDRFLAPFKKTYFYISSGCFYYDGDYAYNSGFHAAVDIAVARYSKIYAVANGIVIDAKAGCPDPGSYNSWCNSGRGNYVFLLVRVKDKYYAVYHYHMNSVAVAPGDKVYEGKTYLGQSGSSGQSTGPHVHFSIYYVGDYPEDTYSSLLRYYQENGFRWGLSYAPSSTCAARGGSAPCFEDPEDIYGWHYPYSYYVS